LPLPLVMSYTPAWSSKSFCWLCTSAPLVVRSCSTIDSIEEMSGKDALVERKSVVEMTLAALINSVSLP